MSTLLSAHLDQINLCATSLAALPFPGPRIFTNALLTPHDITALIRDTEPHERALFHLAPPPSSKSGPAGEVTATPGAGLARRQTSRQARNKAVAAVLGGELFERTRTTGEARGKGEVDVEGLLKGAEKLVGVYPMPGAPDRIAALRRRYQQLKANIAHYEARVAEQTKELQAMNRPTSRGGKSEAEDEDEDEADAGADDVTIIPVTKEDLAREDQEVRVLERKKKGLEERVEGMERDLGGLMR